MCNVLMRENHLYQPPCIKNSDKMMMMIRYLFSTISFGAFRFVSVNNTKPTFCYYFRIRAVWYFTTKEEHYVLKNTLGKMWKRVQLLLCIYFNVCKNM